MESLQFFNMHTHLSRDTQLERLIFPKPNVPDASYWANLDRVVAFMDANHMSHIATMNVMATRAMIESRLRRARAAGRSEAAIAEARVLLREDMRQRVREMNDWSLAAQTREPRIRTYIALDPTLFEDAAVAEVDRCIVLGASGVKLHPNMDEHFPDHPALRAVFERCQDAGIAVLACSGTRPNPDGNVYAAPLAWRPILKTFPRLRLILAHFCDDAWDDRLEMAREFDHLVFDISGGLVDGSNPPNQRSALPIEQAARVFRKVGTERLMWGSDTAFEPMRSVRQILALSLTDLEKERILATNAMQWFGLR